jgi:hypothetical protein
MPMIIAASAGVLCAPSASAHNTRLNNSVAANRYTIQRQAACTNVLHVNPQLRFAAQDRALAAGFHGTASETVAINPALAMSGIEMPNNWWAWRGRPRPHVTPLAP